MPLLFSIVLLTSCGSGGGGGSSNPDTEGSSTNQSSLQAAKNISPYSTDSFNSRIAADSGGGVYVSWEEKGGVSGARIFLSKSGNSGQTFDKAIDVKRYCSGSGDALRDVSILPGGDGHFYLFWVDEWTALNISEVRQFTDKDYLCRPVSNSVAAKEGVYSPMMRLSPDKNIQMVWAQGKSGSPKDIFYKQDSDKNPVNFSGTPLSDSSGPLIGFDGTMTVNVAWVEQAAVSGKREIRFARSADGGSNFYYNDSISEAGVDSYCPALATYDKNNIYVAYKGNNNIYFSKWFFTFFPWVQSLFSSPESISGGSESPSCPEMLTGSDGAVYVVWADKGEIWLSASSDSGSSFSTPENVSQSVGRSSLPRLVMTGANLNVVWVEEDTGSGDIFAATYADNGKTLVKRENLSGSPGVPSLLPSVAADGTDHVYVVWEEGDPGNRHIYFIRF